MIAFDIQCANGHTFEGWFEDAYAYDTQKKDGRLTCPVCDSSDVYKIPATFSIKKPVPTVGKNIDQAALATAGRKIVDFIEKNFDDVGSDFSKENFTG